MLKATVSGSFHRHMPAIYEAVCVLRELGVNVLSPADPRIVDNLGEFLFVASDKLRSIKLVEDRHLEAIRASDLLWVVCPDGYTGPSTSGEILAAAVLKVPVFSNTPALDVTIGQYVRRVPGITAAVEELAVSHRRTFEPPHLLIDPKDAIGQSVRALEALCPVLIDRTHEGRGTADRKLRHVQHFLRHTFGIA
jgi:hypothetical protein